MSKKAEAQNVLPPLVFICVTDYTTAKNFTRKIREII